MIQLRKTLEIAKQLLEAENILFALIGGFALGAHGVHRSTKDIDLLVDGSRKNDIQSLFEKKGFRMIQITNELIQFDGAGYLDIIFANRPLSLEMLKLSGNLTFSGVPVVSAEGIIGLKIQAYKNDPTRIYQDKADIQALLKSVEIDMAKVKYYAELFDAWPDIEELRQ